MKIFFYELYKIIRNRRLIGIGILLFIINIVFCSVYVSDKSQHTVPDSIMSPLYDGYLSAPEKINSEYEERTDSYNKMLEAWLLSGRLDELPAFENRYIETEYLNDNDVYGKLYYNVYRNSEFESTVNDVIGKADEIAQNDFNKNNGYTGIGQKQLFIIEQYKAMLKDTQIGFENTRGWDILLEASFPCIFALVFVVLAIGFIYSYEHINKTFPIILSTPNGRIKTSIPKAFAAVILSVSVLLIFYIPLIIAIASSVGFSSPLNAIQAFEAYSLCPYRLSVIGATIILFFMRSGMLVLIALLINTVAKITGKHLFSILSGSVFCGISLLIYLFAAKLDPTGLSYIMNPFAILINPVPLTRMYTISFMGTTSDAVKIVAASVTILVSVAFVLCLTFNKSVNFPGRLVRSHKPHRTYTVASGRKNHSLFLLRYESVKVFGIGTVCFILILFAVDIVSFYRIYSTPHSVNDTVTEEYMKTYHGVLTDDKIDCIESEYNTLVQVLSEKDEYDKKYLANEIPADEYVEYLKAYQRASHHEAPLTVIYRKAIQPDAADNIWLVYESGWNNLFFGIGDVGIIISIILVSCLVVTKEYECNASGGAFTDILNISKKGHRPTFRAKTVLAVLFAVSLFCFTYAIKLLILKSYWSFDDINAPLCSIGSFSTGGTSITIGRYLFVHLITKCISCVILGFLTMSLSLLVKQKYASLSVSVIILAIPEIIYKYAGIDWAKYITLYSFTDIYCSSSSKALPYALLILVLLLSVSAMLITQQRRFLCGTNR